MMHKLLFILICCSAFIRAETPDGFALPQAGRAFHFPRDHGSHPEFRTEWWYVTGHLDAADGRRFGFQVTFFRQASAKNGVHFHLAHCALSDAKGKTFTHEERLNREGWDAAASTSALDVRNGNWSLRMDGEELHLSSTIHAEIELTLNLKPTKPLVVFGKDGVSRKGAAPGAASHYLTWPRLDARGTVRAGAASHTVKGEAWMDHEFSSSQLDEGQVGWDWAAIQLHDQTEIMVYRMRRADGSADTAGTTLAWIDAKGGVRHLDSTQFSWTPLATWTSAQTKARYPVSARIEAEGRAFVLRPLIDDQELRGDVTGLSYWEGACDVLDAKGEVIGRAFLELAGYAGDLGRHLKAR